MRGRSLRLHGEDASRYIGLGDKVLAFLRQEMDRTKHPTGVKRVRFGDVVVEARIIFGVAYVSVWTGVSKKGEEKRALTYGGFLFLPSTITRDYGEPYVDGEGAPISGTDGGDWPQQVLLTGSDGRLAVSRTIREAMYGQKQWPHYEYVEQYWVDREYQNLMAFEWPDRYGERPTTGTTYYYSFIYNGTYWEGDYQYLLGAWAYQGRMINVSYNPGTKRYLLQWGVESDLNPTWPNTPAWHTIAELSGYGADLNYVVGQPFWANEDGSAAISFLYTGSNKRIVTGVWLVEATVSSLGGGTVVGTLTATDITSEYPNLTDEVTQEVVEASVTVTVDTAPGEIAYTSQTNLGGDSCSEFHSLYYYATITYNPAVEPLPPESDPNWQILNTYYSCLNEYPTGGYDEFGILTVIRPLGVLDPFPGAGNFVLHQLGGQYSVVNQTNRANSISFTFNGVEYTVWNGPSGWYKPDDSAFDADSFLRTQGGVDGTEFVQTVPYPTDLDFCTASASIPSAGLTNLYWEQYRMPVGTGCLPGWAYGGDGYCYRKIPMHRESITTWPLRANDHTLRVDGVCELNTHTRPVGASLMGVDYRAGETVRWEVLGEGEVLRNSRTEVHTESTSAFYSPYNVSTAGAGLVRPDSYDASTYRRYHSIPDLKLPTEWYSNPPTDAAPTYYSAVGDVLGVDLRSTSGVYGSFEWLREEGGDNVYQGTKYLFCAGATHPVFGSEVPVDGRLAIEDVFDVYAEYGTYAHSATDGAGNTMVACWGQGLLSPTPQGAYQAIFFRDDTPGDNTLLVVAAGEFTESDVTFIPFRPMRNVPIESTPVYEPFDDPQNR